ncbi:EfeO-type cupredoxin-like domain-containing protein [Sphingomonas antarctica]|uniref:plastocyanin/azurin family copper-binding protein n=1 Tax=Sphingomonas antarctica TaxID=2040274 RepID=UPI0039E7317C
MLRFVLPLTIALVAAPVSAQDSITVELSNFHFTPSALTLHHGQAYTLHIVNTASGGHDFVAPEFFAASQIAPADRAKVAGGKVDVGGGEAVDIHFTAPAHAATYKLKCSHFLHASFGMTGSITVD